MFIKYNIEAEKSTIRVAFWEKNGYNIGMDIQTASINMGQARLQEEAAIQVQAKALDAVREQAAAVEKLIDSVEVIADPALGQTVSVTA